MPRSDWKNDWRKRQDLKSERRRLGFLHIPLRTPRSGIVPRHHRRYLLGRYNEIIRQCGVGRRYCRPRVLHVSRWGNQARKRLRSTSSQSVPLRKVTTELRSSPQFLLGMQQVVLCLPTDGDPGLTHNDQPFRTTAQMLEPHATHHLPIPLRQFLKSPRAS